MNMKKLILTLLSMSLIFTTVSCQRQPEKYKASFLILFNTVTEVMAVTDTEEEFMEFAEFIRDTLNEYHQLYDKYNLYEGVNNIKTINDSAGIAPVKVDQKIIDMLLFSKEMYEMTDGKVNIALGSVLEIWHDYRNEGIDDPLNAKLPPMEELVAANAYTDINMVIIDEDNSTVYLPDEHMSLDVGAIAKGYATEMVVKEAVNKGYNNFLLSVGGNTRAMGLKGEKDDLWNVGIQNPDKSSHIPTIYTLSITDMSLVASGNYERYYTVDGKIYHHIIDPNTLMPADYFTAVSILTQDSGIADALSTAIYNLPYEEGLKLIEEFEGTEALWIFPNGERKFSESFMDYILEE
ncbi:MAG TPA: FAD:protein FMN transferase [Clostridiales bacterium]|nr:FAD:protein FMN transferase [Clostridiales bacterium]